MKKTLFCLLVFLIFFIASTNTQVSASEEYIVEKNDTLWDISSRKLDDTFLWPKLWNVNPHIGNPDLIYPGTKILIPSREELMKMPDVPTPTKEIPVARKQKTTKSRKKAESKSVWKYAPLMHRKYIVEKNL
ncbi:MAG: LysM peptidoglycan-binding domain-containing protein, partial [Nitrospirota bacterium]